MDWLYEPVQVWHLIVLAIPMLYMYRAIIKTHKCAYDVWGGCLIRRKLSRTIRFRQLQESEGVPRL
jgi:hypothetical protein